MTDSIEEMKVLVCFGTRPEVIKLSPVIESLTSEDIPLKTLFTGQHDELFKDVAHLVPQGTILGGGDAPCYG